MKNEPIHYATPLSIPECIAAVTAEPWEYGDDLAPMWYRCDPVTENSLLVTFRGGKFRKMMQTRYLLTCSEKAGQTIVTLDFRGELLGMPPMTQLSDIDCFCAQKIGAVRLLVEDYLGKTKD